ncbi:biotin--[acetyl-CoA-carboxylase] ligase [Paenibacillus alkalitolerans]|uniref:biotin--[acetyl-CoA-carboxylase] ligase n=1 Tax=Paenibacillus alkalitolerans TaxID=2799335 RepID=UPI0018F47DFE|nr:biotin--[acetyl-CoA-carboxylase] ligase [Paenibacillus alkalitolerans]
MNDTILDIFADSKGEFVSGERLSQILGISRTAVWKRIRRLQAEGYRFESSPRVGYRLLQEPERLQLSALLSMLRTRVFGRTVHISDSVDSTQNVAHEALLAGAPEGAVYLAEQQTSGRGRMGRSWHSPAGKGIWMSFIIKPGLPFKRAPHMTLLISVALCRAIRRTAELDARIKWPNDIMIGGRKTSGILVESIAEADTVTAMIAGVGVSVNLEKEQFPEELRSKATSLKIERGGRAVSRERLIAEFFDQFETLYELYLAEGFAPIRNLWEALTCTLGAAVSVQTAHGPVTGRAEGITEDGALLVKSEDGQSYTLYSGDLQPV